MLSSIFRKVVYVSIKLLEFTNAEIKLICLDQWLSQLEM
jgi:hypothetical protein